MFPHLLTGCFLGWRTRLTCACCRFVLIHVHRAKRVCWSGRCALARPKTTSCGAAMTLFAGAPAAPAAGAPAAGAPAAGPIEGVAFRGEDVSLVPRSKVLTQVLFATWARCRDCGQTRPMSASAFSTVSVARSISPGLTVSGGMKRIVSNTEQPRMSMSRSRQACESLALVPGPARSG